MLAGVLGALVAINYFWFAVPGYLCMHKLGLRFFLQTARKLPANDIATVQIHNRRQVHKSMFH